MGGGVDFTYLKVGLHQHADLSTVALPPPAPPGATFANLGIPTGTDFANVDLTGHAWNMGANVGNHHPGDRPAVVRRPLPQPAAGGADQGRR